MDFWSWDYAYLYFLFNFSFLVCGVSGVVGGLGLNLTSADTLVFMEHDWNPMRDHQVQILFMLFFIENCVINFVTERMNRR